MTSVKSLSRIFDVALEAWMGYNPSLCIFNETCGDAMAIEHNGRSVFLRPLRLA